MKKTAKQQYMDALEKMVSTHWDTSQLIAWMRDAGRKEAVFSFTEGPARQVAYAFERALRMERETTKSPVHLTMRPTEQCPRCAYIQVVHDMPSAELGGHVWLLTTGTGADGDEWSVKSIHATPESAERALARYQTPQKRTNDSTYVRDATVEKWEVD